MSEEQYKSADYLEGYADALAAVHQMAERAYAGPGPKNGWHPHRMRQMVEGMQETALAGYRQLKAQQRLKAGLKQLPAKIKSKSDGIIDFNLDGRTSQFPGRPSEQDPEHIVHPMFRIVTRAHLAELVENTMKELGEQGLMGKRLGELSRPLTEVKADVPKPPWED